MPRIPMVNGDEFDHLTGWRRYVANNHGERARTKRGYRRRERRQGKHEARQAWAEAHEALEVMRLVRIGAYDGE